MTISRSPKPWIHGQDGPSWASHTLESITVKHSFLIEIELNGLNRRDASFIELDDGKIYRKAPYLMGKSMVSG